MVPGLSQIDANLIEMTIHLVALAIQTCLGVHLVLPQGDLMWMMVMVKGLKGLLQVIVKGVPVIMTLFLGRNVHTLQWLVSLLLKSCIIFDNFVYILSYFLIVNSILLTILFLG